MRNATWTLKIRGGGVVVDHGQFGGSDGPGIHKNLQVCLDEPYGPEECPSTQCIFCFQKDKSSDNNTIGLSYIIYIISFPVALPKKI